MSNEDIPKEIAELFAKFQTKEVNSRQRDALCAWIIERKEEDPEWNLSEHIRSLGWDQKSHDRLKKQLSLYSQAVGEAAKKGAKGESSSASSMVRRTERRSREEHFQTWWQQHEGVADIVLEFEPQFAKMPGYYNRQLKTVDVEKAVRDSFEFFIRYTGMVTQLQEQKDNWEAFSQTLMKAHTSDFWWSYYTRLYVWFIAKMQEVELMTGRPVPEFIIDKVAGDIQAAYDGLQVLRVKERRER